jgi:hypothetical protein
MQHITGVNITGTSQVASRVAAHYPSLGYGPHFRPTVANSVPHHVASQIGHTSSNAQTSLMSTSISESLRRRPSLYAVPQWQSFPRTGMAMQTISVNPTKSVYESPYVSIDGTLPGVPSVLSHTAGPADVRPSSNGLQGSIPPQSVFPQSPILKGPTNPPTGVPTSQPISSEPAYPPNMLVDIAQTCQHNFPFAFIAKRHNQPIQKVFDTFSAVIQLPLLRSVVDARRPGKLGSARMKEFRAMKKGVRELNKGEQAGKKRGRKAKGIGIGSA